MNLEKIEELFLALPSLLGHTNTAALRNLGQIATWPTMLYISIKLHLSFNNAIGRISFQFEK